MALRARAEAHSIRTFESRFRAFVERSLAERQEGQDKAVSW
jgi:hypothetical protein